MGRKASTINLSEDERLYLETQMRARTIQAQTVIRARILLLKAEGISVDHIADKVGMNRKSVMLCINKYLEGGVENALFDAPGRGRNAEITDDEKAWIINIACQKPVNLGYSAEVWTRALLTKHINKFAEEAGHTRLSTISQSKVRTILEEADIKPNKITYYCENRDPDFDQKMHNVLLVYKQLSLQFDEKGQLIPFKEDEQVVHVLSYDEKPGIQAIANTTEDLLPDENHKTVSRDYEVFLDMTELPKEVMEHKLAGLVDDCQTYLHKDIRKEPIPILPGIHYFMGGIQVDERHRTSMRNLYAAGECCAQYHGANRLGGNSLLGAIYGGQIAAETACRETVSSPNMPCAEESLLPELSPDAQMQMNRILLNALGVVRDAQTLEAGIQEIRKLSGTLPLLGCAMLESALARKESRGAHWRADYPQHNDAVYCKTTVAHWNGQHIAISFESIPERRHDL